LIGPVCDATVTPLKMRMRSVDYTRRAPSSTAVRPGVLV
jgi:hypothetical protein